MSLTNSLNTKVTSAMKGFKLEAKDAMSIVDKFTALDVSAATTAGDIAEGLAQFANVARMNGVDMDSAAAMVATIADVTQSSGSQVGNAMKMILSRYSNVKSGAYSKLNIEGESGDTTENLNEVEKIISKLGISMRTTNLEFRSFTDTLGDIAKRWDTLDSVSKNAISGALAGTRNREAVSALLENYDKYQSLLEVSRNSAGTAERKYQSYQEQLEAQNKRLQAAWEKFANSADVQKMLIWVTKMSTYVVKYLPTIAKAVGNFLAMQNAYKVPLMLRSMSGWLGFGKPGEQITAGDVFKGVGGIFSGRIHRNKILEAYSNKPEQSILQRAIGSVERNIQALQGKAPLQQRGSAASAKGAGAAAVLQAGVGAAMGAMTASTSSQVNGETYEMSKTAAATSRGSKAIVQGLGSIVSPAVGTLLGMASDFVFTNWIGPLIDAASIHLQERVKEAQKNLSLFSGLKENIGTIGNLSSLPQLTASENEQLNLAIDNLISDLTKRDEEGNDINKEARNRFTDILYEIMSNQGLQVEATDDVGALLDKGLAQNAKLTAHALAIAQARSNAEELRRSLEGDYNKLGTQSSDIYKNIAKDAERQARTFARDMSALAGGGAIGAGAGAGAGIGAAIGSAGGPIGTGVGAAAGAIVGLIGGIFTGTAAYNAAYEGKMEELSRGWNSSGYSGRIEVAEELKENKEKILESITSDMSFDDFAKIAKQFDFNIPFNGNYNYRAMYENNDIKRAEFQEQLIDLINQSIESDKDSLREIKEIKTQTYKLNEKYDTALVDTALLEAQTEGGEYLSLMTTIQKKNLGIDNLVRIIANQLIASGGLENSDVYINESTGELTSYARDKIMKAMRNNENYASVFGSYRLNEVLGLPSETEGKINYYNLEMKKNFANALGVDISNLSSQAGVYGNFTLAELLMGSKESLEKIKTIGDLMSDIASSSKSWSETTNQVISNFPELIPYLDDSVKLTANLFGLSQSFAQREIKGKFDDIGSSENFYSEVLKKQLKQQDWYNQLIKDPKFNEVTSLSGLISWVITSEDVEINEAINEIVKESLKGVTLISDATKEQISSVIKWEETLLDYQINNLTAQKEALSEINKQREYELSLMEARQKLENAQTQMKRVYRNGMWVYEADQSAILEAQKAYDEVSRRKEISGLDLAISDLTAEKQALGRISEEESLQRMKESALGIEKVLTESGSPATAAGLRNILEESFKGISETANNIYDAMLGEEETKKNVARRDFSSLFGKEWEANVNLGNLGAANMTERQKTAYNEAVYSLRKWYGENGKYIDTNSLTALQQDVIAKKGYEEIDTLDSIKAKYNSKDIKLTESTDFMSEKDVEEVWKKWENGKILAFFGPDRSGVVMKTKGNYNTLQDWASANPKTFLRDEGKNKWYYVDGLGALKRATMEENASGTMSFKGGNTMINERGIEAIVTPEGTITSLPAKSGILPADLTENLYQLGKMSPFIANQLLGGPSSVSDGIGPRTYTNSTDNSLNISSLFMDVKADGSFDVEKFANELRTRIDLTKNSNKS